MNIVLEPVTTSLDCCTIKRLAYDISKVFRGSKVTIDSPILIDKAEIELAFDNQRNQWNSPKLLDAFYDRLKPNENRIIDFDAYSNGLNFVLGEAFPKGRLGAVHLARIKEEFYGLRSNKKLFYQRMIKECVHELGHIFGFNHCSNLECVMHFSNSLSDTDIKGKSFCSKCRIKNSVF